MCRGKKKRNNLKIVLPLFGKQLIDKSSSCPQLCDPQSLCLHSSIAVSDPSQMISSSQIGPDPCPYAAQQKVSEVFLIIKKNLLYISFNTSADRKMSFSFFQTSCPVQTVVSP